MVTSEMDKLLKEVRELKARAARVIVNTALLQQELEGSRQAFRAAIQDSQTLKETHTQRRGPIYTFEARFVRTKRTWASLSVAG